MDIVQLEGIEFYAFHGCYKEERLVGNKFIVDISIETECKVASETDNIKDALNYQHVYDLVKKEMDIKSHLLENIAKRIIDIIYLNFKLINKITVKISKVNPPVGGKMNKVSVTLSR